MKKILTVICALAIIATAVIAGFVMTGGDIGFLIKQGIQDKGSEVMGVPVTVENVDMPILTGIGKIENLIITNPQGEESDYTFKMGILNIEIDPETIKTEKVRIKKLIIDSPEISFEGDIKNNNIMQLQKNIQANKKDEKKKEKKVQLDYLKIQNGKLKLQFKGLKSKTITLADLELENIGSGGDTSISEMGQQIMRQFLKIITATLKKEMGGNIKKIKDKIKPPFKRPGPFGK
ncbi:hypothetical protein [Candidatus Uabimicrobium sp. HlEnr_7]|uniref:hypothetical protein n=1 Tax=Candidatus Uabimicrobium helgolandensis TaxID=3095367 RepID=UPI00355898AC